MLLASIPGNMQAWILFFRERCPGTTSQIGTCHVGRLSWTNIQAVSAISKSHFFYLSFLSISRIDRCSQKHLNSFFESMQMKPLHQGRIRLYTCRSNICRSNHLQFPWAQIAWKLSSKNRYLMDDFYAGYGIRTRELLRDRILSPARRARASHCARLSIFADMVTSGIVILY